MLFSFDENKLLGELSARPTLEILSSKLNKDPSVISRDLKRIAEKAPVIEKINGRWVLTELGTKLALWAKKIEIEESEILGTEYTLTIATTREFASRILAKNFRQLDWGSVRYNIITCENGVEAALINGHADIGLDCGGPTDPAIAFKKVIQEDIVSVASVKFVREKKIKTLSEAREEDFLFYSRLRPLKEIDVSKSKFGSNDVSVLRTLVMDHHGWATLPYYAVKEEIESKKLAIIPGGEIKGYQFGVWWPRGRKLLEGRIKELEKWLGKQDLVSKLR